MILFKKIGSFTIVFLIFVSLQLSTVIAYDTTPIFNSKNIEDLRIYEIQGSGTESPYLGKIVKTQGAVTLCLFGEGQLGGFFIQDTLGDESKQTSDGIFVYSRKYDVKEGDYVSFTATVDEWKYRTQLKDCKDLIVHKEGVEVNYLDFILPLDFTDANNLYESFEGMKVRFKQPLYITNTGNLSYYGQLGLSSKLLYTPTNVAFPLSAEYEEVLAGNAIDKIVLDDGSLQYKPNPIPFLDTDNTCRIGNKTDSLCGVLDQVTQYIYVFQSFYNLNFYGNPRDANFDESLLGDYDIKVCAFNVEHFANESNLQLTRIVKTMSAIDADIFGLCEVREGNAYIKALVDALNKYNGAEEYTYINLGDGESEYSVVQIIYKNIIVEPYLDFVQINDVWPPNRKLIQGFRLRSNGEKFILSLNHFKAKSGTGTGLDADQGDGQGVYNYTRLQEAYAVRNRLKELEFKYETDRCLVIGDLNACAMEDPLEVFYDVGYKNSVEEFDKGSYTYTFNGQLQYLDYILVNEAIQNFVTGAFNWHINSVEPGFLDYQNSSSTDNFLFRSSDHDPVIVGLNFGSTHNEKIEDNKIVLFPNPCTDYFYISSKFPSLDKPTIRIYTARGVLCKEYNDMSSPIYVGDLATGLYFVNIISGNINISKKIVIN